MLKKTINFLRKIYFPENIHEKLYSSVIIYLFFSFVFVAILSFGMAGYDYCFADKSFVEKLREYFTGKLSIIIGFFSFFIQFIVMFLDHHHKKTLNTEQRIEHSLKTYQSTISEKIDEHLNNARIVFEAGIKDFDDAHLLVLQKILNNLDSSVSNIYVVDHSDPIQWWSDSMTGYLSLLAKWRANCAANNRRQIHRIFIFTKNELLNPVTIKTVAFHSLLGFHTYIFEEKMYKILFEEYRKKLGSECKIRMKELLLWDIIPDFHPVSFKIDDSPWDDILFYQSFWDIDRHKKRERSDLMKDKNSKWIDYHERHLTSEKISIWFEFMPRNATTEIMAKQQIDLMEFLISKSYCCRYEFELINELERNPSSLGASFGIEIKTGECAKCESTLVEERAKDVRCLSIKDKEAFEYVSTKEIRAILKLYNHQSN